MILDAKSGIRGTIVDLDTGRPLRKVITLNTDTGYFKAYQVDVNGAILRDGHGNYLTYEGVVRFKFVPTDRSKVREITMGAPRCAKCQSTMTLPGDDLCPICRAKETGQKNKMTCEPVDDLERGHKCEKCSRQSTWAVSDEVAVTPQLSGFRIERRGRRRVRVVVPEAGGKQQWQRAMTVKRRYYCDRCYSPPAIVDAKGEVISEIETKVRPD